MAYYISKILISAVLIVAISEVAKRSSLMGALLASIPLVSILAMSWIYLETKDLEKLSEFSYSVFWLVLPSLTLFLTFPLLIKKDFNFYLSMSGAILATMLAYGLMILVLSQFDIKI